MITAREVVDLTGAQWDGDRWTFHCPLCQKNRNSIPAVTITFDAKNQRAWFKCANRCDVGRVIYRTPLGARQADLATVVQFADLEALKKPKKTKPTPKKPAPAPVVNGQPITWNDDNRVGNARMASRFAQFADGRAMYVPNKGWHVWNGRYWAPDTDEAGVYCILDELTMVCWTEARDNAELERDVKAAMSGSGAGWVLKLASKKMQRTEVDQDPYLLNCENGTLNLRTLTLQEHDPADFITKSTGINYDPGAEGKDWNSFLESSLPDHEVRGFLQRYVGLALIGTVREHVLGIMTGSGRNGKGVFVRALENALGDYVGPSTTDIFLRGKYADTAKRSAQDNDALMGLKGCRLAFVSELPQGSTMDEAAMKYLTGGDKIKAKYSHGRYEEFDPTHSFLLQTNHLPQVDADSKASWARIRVIPWEVSFEGREDTGLGERLAQDTEREACLAWCVAGLADYWKRGGLDAPEKVLMSTHAYQADNDAFAKFIAESAELDPEGFVIKDDFKALFDRWSRDNDADPLSGPKIKEKMLALPGVREGRKRPAGAPKNTSARAAWTGIRLKDAD